MELTLFEGVAEACRSLIPAEFGQLHVRARSYGVKLWFGPADPPRAHYEAQVIGVQHVPAATTLAIEVGFHLEHRSFQENDAAFEALLEDEERWRPVLGDEAVAGPFLGREDDWRRISETWADPDLSNPDLALDLAARLTDYVSALEPIRYRPR